MNASVAAAKKIWTEAELQALPEDGFIHELIDGGILMSPKNDSFQGYISSKLLAALVVFAESRRLGVVWDSSTGFRMNNLNIRAPDISFISYARLNALGFDVSSRGFIPGAPDLAVEVLSLHNTRKGSLPFAHGAPMGRSHRHSGWRRRSARIPLSCRRLVPSLARSMKTIKTRTMTSGS